MNKKQKHDYRVLSDKVCSCCGNPLKQNLVDRISNATLDYICYRYMNKGNLTIQKIVQYKEKGTNEVRQRVLNLRLIDIIRDRRKANNFTSHIKLSK